MRKDLRFTKEFKKVSKAFDKPEWSNLFVTVYEIVTYVNGDLYIRPMDCHSFQTVLDRILQGHSFWLRSEKIVRSVCYYLRGGASNMHYTLIAKG